MENENKTVLKIRFILLKKAIVMEILRQNDDLLGFNGESRQTFEATNGWFLQVAPSEAATGLYQTQLIFQYKGEGDVAKSYDADFQALKAALTEFAACNTFHGKFRLMFNSEWRRHFPAELNISDFDKRQQARRELWEFYKNDFGAEIKFDEQRFFNDMLLDAGIVIGTEFVNHQNRGMEIWEFTMTGI